MKTILKRGVAFLLVLLLVLAAVDIAFGRIIARYGQGGYLPPSDYDVTRRDHPEEAWDRVFFGSSNIIAAYREDRSAAGYVNAGLDYGVITDLWEMLDEGYMTVGSELVIGADWLTFYDELDTNPAYPWHRGPLEPQLYFRRDDAMTLAKNTAKRLLGRETAPPYVYAGKWLYHGALSAGELQGKTQLYEQLYYHIPMEQFSKNLRALEKVSGWCRDNSVRLRLIWMPWNPDVPQPEIIAQVQETVDALCAQQGIEVRDMLDAMDASCFHDVGHLNYEYGACRFTQEVDPWLAS